MMALPGTNGQYSDFWLILRGRILLQTDIRHGLETKDQTGNPHGSVSGHESI